MSGECLIIFTRYPEPGKAKTRLVPALGAEGAAALHRQMTEHTLKQVRELQSQHSLEVEVHFTGGNQQLMENWLGSKVVCQPQPEGDLGFRMASAFQTAFNKGMSRVAIIGTDCPDLSAKIIAQAFSALTHHDLVLGPAQDGGYYLIGLCQLLPKLFIGIPWGTSDVLRQTTDVAQHLNLAIHYLSVLTDVDRPEDLLCILPSWRMLQ